MDWCMCNSHWCLNPWTTGRMGKKKMNMSRNNSSSNHLESNDWNGHGWLHKYIFFAAAAYSQFLCSSQQRRMCVVFCCVQSLCDFAQCVCVSCARKTMEPSVCAQVKQYYSDRQVQANSGTLFARLATRETVRFALNHIIEVTKTTKK